MVKTETVKDKKIDDSSRFLINITCEEFYSHVLKSERLVVVDFWAEWCASCHTIKPILEKLAEKYKNRIAFYRVNADACPNLVSTYQITSLPTLVIYYQGNSVERLVGATKISDYERFIENAIIRLNN
ncbi:MAG: thioredoxin [bacterium]